MNTICVTLSLICIVAAISAESPSKRENTKRSCDCDNVTPDCEDYCLMEQFCDSACKQGLAGPECNCPDHPIGKREAHAKRNNVKRECDCHDFDWDLITPDCEDYCVFQEFCSEACIEGIGGPECGCPGHPIGKRGVMAGKYRRTMMARIMKEKRNSK
uniref:Uncharacterized protein n=1 Tax=Clytia hemisphaerica TaxID=252671 RepID=A0A7M6DNN8_9CNID